MLVCMYEILGIFAVALIKNNINDQKSFSSASYRHSLADQGFHLLQVVQGVRKQLDHWVPVTLKSQEGQGVQEGLGGLADHGHSVEQTQK